MILKWDQGTLLLYNWHHGKPPSSITPYPWRWDKRVDLWRCHAIYYQEVNQELSQNPDYVDMVMKPVSVNCPEIDLPILRSEQNQALDRWEQQGCRGQVIMPTGTGKTEVALAAMVETEIATLVVAPIRDLMYQWHRRIFKGLGYDAGIVGDNTFKVKAITVTTYDSAYIHMNKMGAGFGLLIFDEEHHLPSKCRREAAILSTAPMRMGLTATPERSDGLHKDLDFLIGPVVYHMPFKEAKESTLAAFDIVRIPIALSNQEQRAYDKCSKMIKKYFFSRRTDKPGYNWNDLCKESNKNVQARHMLKAFHSKASIESRALEKLRVLEDIFRLHNDQLILVFVGSNAMAIEVSKRFLVPTILSHTGKKERLVVLDGFANGKFKVVVANQVLDEGINVPEAKIGVVIGGHGSTRQAKQRLGRIMRKNGNNRATLYEVVCENTKEVQKSRARRRSDAYERTIHRRI